MKPKRPIAGYIADLARSLGADPRLVRQRMRVKRWSFAMAVHVPSGRAGAGSRKRYGETVRALRRTA